MCRLSDRVLHLAEKYLASGDLWGFLHEVDADYTFYRKQISRHEQSEVLQFQRASQLCHTHLTSCVVNALQNEAVCMYVDKVVKERQALFEQSWANFQDVTANSGTKERGGRTRKNGSATMPPPGPVLRRVYGTDPSSRKMKRKRPRPQGQRLEHATAAASPSTLSTAQAGFSTTLNKPSNESHEDVMTAESAVAAASVMQDLPAGVNETVDKLLKLAALHVFVPPQMGESTPEEAFAVYRSLPNCLAKVRHQQQAHEYVRDSIAQLQSKGYRFVSDLIPVSKISTTFSGKGSLRAFVGCA